MSLTRQRGEVVALLLDVAAHGGIAGGGSLGAGLRVQFSSMLTQLAQELVVLVRKERRSRRRRDDGRVVEDDIADGMVAVEVAIYYVARRSPGQPLRRRAQVTRRRCRQHRVEDQRLSAQIEDAGVAHRTAALRGDGEEETLAQLFEAKVARGRQACVRRGHR